MRGEIARNDTFWHISEAQRDEITSALAGAIELNPYDDPCKITQEVTGHPHLAVATGLAGLIQDNTFARRADGHLGLNQDHLAVDDYRNPEQRRNSDLPLSQREEIQSLVIASILNYPNENPSNAVALATNLEEEDITKEQKALEEEGVISARWRTNGFKRKSLKK